MTLRSHTRNKNYKTTKIWKEDLCEGIGGPHTHRTAFPTSPLPSSTAQIGKGYTEGVSTPIRPAGALPHVCHTRRGTARGHLTPLATVTHP